MAGFDTPDGISYAQGTGESTTADDSLDEKVDSARSVLKTALEQYGNPALLWNGGKDSTLTLHYLQEVCESLNREIPPVIFIDHLQHLHDVHMFVQQWSDRLGLTVVTAQNMNIKEIIREWDVEPGETFPVALLTEASQRYVRDELAVTTDTIEFSRETVVGRYLLETVALSNALATHHFDAIITGSRWDDQRTPQDETVFSPRHEHPVLSPHDRVNPILPFTEAEVWEATWTDLVPAHVEEYDRDAPPSDVTDLPGELTAPELPVLPKYFDGYRFVESAEVAEKTGKEPAWEQDRSEFGGRDEQDQEKEELQQKLRSLGYL